MPGVRLFVERTSNRRRVSADPKERVPSNRGQTSKRTRGTAAKLAKSAGVSRQASPSHTLPQRTFTAAR
jgi:hypothetical protein